MLSVLRAGCTTIPGMMVEAASVDWAYIDGAYVEPERSGDMDAFEGDAPCLTYPSEALRRIVLDRPEIEPLRLVRLSK